MHPDCLTVGIVGHGGMASVMAKEIAATDGVDATVVVTRERLDGERFASAHDIARSATVDSLVSLDVDIIYIATTPDSHHRLASTALDSGHHVVVEKAFTRTSAEAADLISRSITTGRFLMEAMWMRFNPAVRAVHAALESGDIGQPRSMSATFGRAVPRDSGHRLWDAERRGGSLLDQTVYPLALADLVFGAPETVDAHGSYLDNSGVQVSVDTEVSALLGYAGGEQATLSTSIRAELPRRAWISGSEGSIEFDAPFWATGSFAITRPGAPAYRSTSAIEGAGYRPMLRAVRDAVRSGAVEHPLADHASTLRVMNVVDAIRAGLRSRTLSGYGEA